MVVLTVHTLAGDTCWGPSDVDSDYTVDQLRKDVAEAIKRPASSLRLLKDTEILSKGGFSEDANITLQLVGPQTYAEECLSYLGSCPTVATPEHSAWLEEAKTQLLPSLQVLQEMDESELKGVKQVRSLCLQLLDSERTDIYASPMERYPDEASVRAMEILRRTASRGEAEVVRVMKFWLDKIVFFDMEPEEITTSPETVFQVCKAVPDLVSMGDMEVIELLCNKLFNKINHYTIANDPFIHMCLEAAVSICKESPDGAQKILDTLSMILFENHWIYNTEHGKACLIYACRLEQMTGRNEGRSEAFLRIHGVEVSADDAIEPVTLAQLKVPKEEVEQWREQYLETHLEGLCMPSETQTMLEVLLGKGKGK